MDIIASWLIVVYKTILILNTACLAIFPLFKIEADLRRHAASKCSDQLMPNGF